MASPTRAQATEATTIPAAAKTNPKKPNAKKKKSLGFRPLESKCPFIHTTPCLAPKLNSGHTDTVAKRI